MRTLVFMLRFVTVIFAIWFVIELARANERMMADERTDSGTIRETIWMSRECRGSHWYLENSDGHSVTLECTPMEDDE